ncbi:MAG: DNA gyrase subunit A [Gemmatimonadetes bacterium]|nr:DNA gyrase subunit A [Gemmatimonadota bacterium]
MVDACIHQIDHPECTVLDLLKFVRGPDFPTGAHICGDEGVLEAYMTGRGRIVMRARAEIEEPASGRPAIIVTEVPFMVNKARMIEQIAQLVREKKLTDISDLRDESDRDGIRVVIELKRDAIPQIVLNQLYKHTQMQSTFGVIMLALVEGVPQIMNLREIIQHFIDHRHRVVVRRTEHDLKQALEREHILEGLRIALDAIDDVVALIRSSPDTDTASTRLQEQFALSERQAKAILDMRLARLTGLEIEKLDAELTEVRAQITDLRDILEHRERRMTIVKDELREVAQTYGDDRRTRFVAAEGFIGIEDLLADEDHVITVSHHGYIKRVQLATYRSQRRGGRGLQGVTTREDDWVEQIYTAQTHDVLMVFTARGHCYWLKVHEIPVGSRESRGKPIVNLLALAADERIAAVVPVREFSDTRSLMFATRRGTVKKTALSAYRNMRVVGVNAINVTDDDELIDVTITNGDDEVLLATRDGMAIRFHESDVREMGRVATGVRGIRLRRTDEVIGMVVIRPETRETATLLTVTDQGRGKRSAVDEYPLQNRGGLGVINFKLTDQTGRAIAAKGVQDSDELVLITRNGVMNRQRVSDMRVIGRATQGVRVVTLDEGDSIVDIARVVPEDDADGEGEGAGEEKFGLEVGGEGGLEFEEGDGNGEGKGQGEGQGDGGSGHA